MSDPYSDGWAALSEDKGPDSCPHPYGSPEWHEWMGGWGDHRDYSDHCDWLDAQEDG